jgi:hypothetical protein
MTMTVQIKRKKKTISKQLQDALDAIPSPDFEKLQPKVDRVFTIGREEGFSDKQIGKLVRKKMKGQYGHDTIWRVFEDYPEARQKQNHKKVPKTRTFDEGICPKCGKPLNEQALEPGDKYKPYQQVIEVKDKLIRELREENEGLRKKIRELERKVPKKPKSNVPKMAAQKEKDAMWLKLVDHVAQQKEQKKKETEEQEK